MNINPKIVSFFDAGIFPAMQSSGSYMNPQKIVQSETISTAKASIPSYNTIDAWSPPPSTWPSNAAPTTSTQYYPEGVVSSDTRYATASAPPYSSVNAGYSQPSTWPNHVAPPTFTQYNTVKQIQDYGQMTACSADSVPCVDAGPFSTMQPSNFHKNPQNVVSATASAPIHSSFETGWPKQSTWPSNVATSTFNPGMQSSGSYINPQEVVPSETRYATTSAPPQSHVDSGYSQPSSSSSHVAPPTTTQYPMEQFQAFAQLMAARSVVLSLEARVMRSGLFPGIQFSGSYMNPPEVVSSETRYVATTSAPPKWPQPLAPFSNTTPQTFTQKPMEQFQNNRQTKLSSPISPFQAFMVPSSRYMHPPEVVESETSHVARVEQDENLDPGNTDCKKRQRFDGRAVSILKNHYLEDQYPSKAKKEDLANQTGLTNKKVGRWFADHRKRDPTTVKRNRKPYEQEARMASTEDSENVDPVARPKDFRQASTSTMVNGNLLGVAKHPSNLRRVKDERTLSILRKHYLEDPYLAPTKRMDLANQTGLTQMQVADWFAGRRRKERKAEKMPKKKYHNKLTVSTLRKHYLQGPYLSLTRKKELAKQTGLTPKQVNRWFINRRRSDWVAEVKKIEQNGNVIDAINRHSVESTPSKASESVDFSSQSVLMIAPEDLQTPMQLQMAPTHDHTGVMQNPPKPLSPQDLRQLN